MYIQSKEGQQYTFSVELSPQEINEQKLAETISYFDNTLHKEKDVKELQYASNIEIPVHVFREGNNGLRAIVRFLKDEKKINFSKIAVLLNRDQRTIWSAYNTSHPIKSKTAKNSNEPTINASFFADRNFSILENAAIYLLKKYSVKETAQILGRKDMTIWTVKRRAEVKKNSKEKNKNENRKQ